MPTTYAIPNGRTVFDATTYTGNGSTQNINNTNSGTTGFKPDMVWMKSRSSVIAHILDDSIRGVSRSIYPNATSVEAYYAGYNVTAFNSNGFTVGDNTAGDYGSNGNAQSYVAWQWQAGQGTTNSNTNGSITSTTSVNATAGFSIVTYTAPSSGAFTIGHGLGVAPAFIITKSRTNAYSWGTYHQSIGNTGRLNLNVTDPVATTQNAGWNNTSPTSTVFSMGSDWAGSGITYVAYCWAEVAGFSKFGSYTGNGSADGPFIYTGFRPKFVLIKNSGTTADWILWDSARNAFNVTNSKLSPNTSGAEYTDTTAVGIDFVSNGFKLRGTDVAVNGSSNNYIYAAFAENPFKYANAR